MLGAQGSGAEGVVPVEAGQALGVQKPLPLS